MTINQKAIQKYLDFTYSTIHHKQMKTCQWEENIASLQQQLQLWYEIVLRAGNEKNHFT